MAGDPENLQIMYGITGERDLRERELPWLPGYEGSAPVRVGNGAANQLQLDVYGEVIDTLYLAHQSGVAHCADTAVLHQRLIEHLVQRWREPDEGIWEIRGARRALRPFQGDGMGGGRPHHPPGRGRRARHGRGPAGRAAGGDPPGGL
ncbi:hypothetical protein GCM10020256_10240 [Streptomyces thermocoprophilus]